MPTPQAASLAPNYAASSSSGLQVPASNAPNLSMYSPYQEVPVGSQPGAPQYMPGYDPATMSMGPQLNSMLNQTQLNTDGLDKFSQEAMRTGPSAWSQMANSQNNLSAQTQQEQAARQAGSTASESRSQLAMSGGLSGGARERVQRDSGRNYLGMSQNISRQADQNSQQIGVNDEQNRISQLGQLPGMENQAYQADLDKIKLWGQGQMFDTNNQIGEAGKQNDFNLGRYHEGMAAWGANQQAQATANAPSGGISYICTALRDGGHLSQGEARRMTDFMLASFLPRADFMAWYFEHAPQAVELAKRQNFDFGLIKDRYVTDILAFDLSTPDGLEQAQDLYAARAGELVTLFLGSRAGYQASFGRAGMFKSLLAWPKMLASQAARTWLKAYFTPRIRRAITRSRVGQLVLGGR